ncbi:MAG TPA: hypothetical protein VMG10_25920 [Gemmataceae bacterium]|nr:hypothetical protein [Gemmataceae bacterium]
MAAPKQKDKPKSIEFYGGYEVYSESGVDLTLLRGNLRRSVEERLANNSRAAVGALALWQSNPHRHLLKSSLHSITRVPDASDLLKLLLSHKVQFVLIGGQAMVALDSAYVTFDTDICYERTPENLAALVAALAPIHPSQRGAPTDRPFDFNVPKLAAGDSFSLHTDQGEIDLFGEVSGIGDYDQVLAQSVEKTVHGMTIRILSVEGLIATKKATARHHDQLHLLELLELKKILDAAKPVQETKGEQSTKGDSPE